MNDNVIVSSVSHSSITTYHTTTCRRVWDIDAKRYLSRDRAEAEGYRECKYCSGEFESNGGQAKLKRIFEDAGVELPDGVVRG
jgi:hypothetical protein